MTGSAADDCDGVSVEGGFVCVAVDVGFVRTFSAHCDFVGVSAEERLVTTDDDAEARLA